MMKMKMILNDLVDATYGDSPKKKAYKSFYVKMSGKTYKRRHGDYEYKTRTINVYNLYRADVLIIATTIHELAHHIDSMNRERSGHDKAFYAVFEKLLYKALDMKLFTKSDFLSANRDASDSNKIAKMIERYKPRDAKYKADRCVISVHNGYEIRKQLYNAKYIFDDINKNWDKEIPKEDLEKEAAFLKSLNASYVVRKVTDIHFDRKCYIVAEKGSYEFRDQLVAAGFEFKKKNGESFWRKEGEPRDIDLYKAKYPRIKWSIKNE